MPKLVNKVKLPEATRKDTEEKLWKTTEHVKLSAATRKNTEAKTMQNKTKTTFCGYSPRHGGKTYAKTGETVKYHAATRKDTEAKNRKKLLNA